MGAKESKPEAEEIKPNLKSISSLANKYSLDKNSEAFSDMSLNPEINITVIISACMIMLLLFMYKNNKN